MEILKLKPKRKTLEEEERRVQGIEAHGSIDRGPSDRGGDGAPSGANPAKTAPVNVAIPGEKKKYGVEAVGGSPATTIQASRVTSPEKEEGKGNRAGITLRRTFALGAPGKKKTVVGVPRDEPPTLTTMRAIETPESLIQFSGDDVEDCPDEVDKDYVGMSGKRFIPPLPSMRNPHQPHETMRGGIVDGGGGVTPSIAAPALEMYEVAGERRQRDSMEESDYPDEGIPTMYQ